MDNAEIMEKSSIDVENIRADFPVLSKQIGGRPLIYLDNGATTQKPQAVIDRVSQFDSEEYGTVRRGSYRLCERSTQLYEEVRQKVANFLGAPTKQEVVFTSGTTQSINLVAHGFGRKFVNAGDEVIISHIEHHANTVPWQVLCEEKGAKLKVIPVNDDGELIMEEYDRLLTDKTRIVAVNHVSNALGTINPVKEITAKAHTAGAKVLIDGAQSMPHMKVDVQDIGCDFYTFSGHKMYAPSGVGGMFGRMEVMETMSPYVTGGDMILQVTLEKTTYAKPPARFEAGTPPITQVIGLGAAIDYLDAIGMDRIFEYEKSLLDYGTRLLQEIDGLRIIGNAADKAAILSIYLESAHPHDIITMLDQDGIALRGGHHCAQPTMIRFGVPATARASMAFYNKFEELDALAESLRKIIKFFS
ncbi:MAG: cysteine desulfurase [Nitrospinaceae bacterium]|jgi:cysteine desulfurase/selenocysteine lyase|nr:cysteine desulfurase [Nitrospinaceae bacterium]MDP6735122.1 cysteine desulfurase [Nitrospinaceae bacterium]|tara:strand:+ start:155 stop:1402 length:1248 start_codon:yes stop_codon:yes gene_type:complete